MRCGNHGDATADEIGHQRRQAIILALQPVVLDHHVLVLNVAGFVEAFAEGSARARGILGRPGTDEADDRHRRLLRARCDRPRDGRATGKRDELAPPHVRSPRPRAAHYHTVAGNAALCITAKFGGQCPRWVNLGPYPLGSNVSFGQQRTLAAGAKTTRGPAHGTAS